MAAVTYIGAADVTHCSAMTRAAGSSDVKVNGIGISREDDVNTAHILPGTPCTTPAKPITTGSTTVFVNGKGCGRVGDGITVCTSVAQGSPNVFAGG